MIWITLIVWTCVLVAVVFVGWGRRLNHRAHCLTEYAQGLDERARLLGIAERADAEAVCDGVLDPLMRDIRPHLRLARDAS